MSETTINVDTTSNPIIYVDVIGGCGSGGGAGADEVWVATEPPVEAGYELWVDTDAEPVVLSGDGVVTPRPAPRRRYQRAAPQHRASMPASMDHITALLVRIEQLEQRLREVEERYAN